MGFANQPPPRTRSRVNVALVHQSWPMKRSLMVGAGQRKPKVATKRMKRHMAAPSNGMKLRKFGISYQPLTRTTKWRRRISKRRKPMRGKPSKFKDKKPQLLRLLISRPDKPQLKRLQWTIARRLSMLDQPTMPKTPLTSQSCLRILSMALHTRELLPKTPLTSQSSLRILSMAMLTRELLPRTPLLRTLFLRELLHWLLLTRSHP